MTSRLLRSWSFWVVAGVVVLLFLVWIPSWTVRGKLPQVGEPIADFTLEDSEGQPFRLSDAYKDNELILVFYRGYG